jgi:hypothetical protein
METKEVKIVPPEGYEIDKENSTLECIKFKPITKSWRDDYSKSISGYVIDINSIIYKRNNVTNGSSNYNLFASKKQAKSALAMAQISQIMANDERFGGIITDEEWKLNTITKYTIGRGDGEISKGYHSFLYSFLAFHTYEQRELFLKENEDLVRDYLML